MATFSKRHYIAIAGVFAGNNGNISENVRHGHTGGDIGQVQRDTANLLAVRLADTFASDNPAFYRERFLRACGL